MPLPIMFDGFVEEKKRVSPTCLINFHRSRYSVPASFANRPVSLHIYPERLVVVAEGHVICTHERIIERSHRQPGRVIYDWRHYLAVVQRKPGALRIRGRARRELLSNLVFWERHAAARSGVDGLMPLMKSTPSMTSARWATPRSLRQLVSAH